MKSYRGVIFEVIPSGIKCGIFPQELSKSDFAERVDMDRGEYEYASWLPSTYQKVVFRFDNNWQHDEYLPLVRKDVILEVNAGKVIDVTPYKPANECHFCKNRTIVSNFWGYGLCGCPQCLNNCFFTVTKEIPGYYPAEEANDRDYKVEFKEKRGWMDHEGRDVDRIEATRISYDYHATKRPMCKRCFGGAMTEDNFKTFLQTEFQESFRPRNINGRSIWE